MPTESYVRPVALFLFAHQDDEFGVFSAIEDELKSGRRVVCVYTTDGGYGDANPLLRNDESLSVLGRLGVPSADVYFLGEQVGIRDTQLYLSLMAGWQALNKLVAELGDIQALYTPAWEGGHPDHDATYAIAVLLQQRLRLVESAWQFSLYNGSGLAGPLFRTLAPLPQNGTVYSRPIDWPGRFRFLRLCLAYRSQKKTWLGLFPFVFLKYIFVGQQQLQHLHREMPSLRPHAGALYYERRKFLTWEVFFEHLLLFSQQVLPPSSVA
jgi:LmbE family N-acetylglucosaminyl deacetylase